MIKWLATTLIVAATTNGAQSCDTNPNDVNQFGSNPVIYDCELDINGPRNFHGEVAYYVRNYCKDPDNIPQVQIMSLWVESRPGIFDNWTQTGTVTGLNQRPKFPTGETTLVVGGRCESGTEVRLAWHVLGTTSKGQDFGPINKAKPGDPAPC